MRCRSVVLTRTLAAIRRGRLASFCAANRTHCGVVQSPSRPTGYGIRISKAQPKNLPFDCSPFTPQTQEHKTVPVLQAGPYFRIAKETSGEVCHP